MGTRASYLHTNNRTQSITTAMADTSSQMPTPSMPIASILFAAITVGNVERPNDGANNTVPLLMVYSCKLIIFCPQTTVSNKFCHFFSIPPNLLQPFKSSCMMSSLFKSFNIFVAVSRMEIILLLIL